jgi:hypothetical protein
MNFTHPSPAFPFTWQAAASSFFRNTSGALPRLRGRRGRHPLFSVVHAPPRPTADSVTRPQPKARKSHAKPQRCKGKTEIRSLQGYKGESINHGLPCDPVYVNPRSSHPAEFPGCRFLLFVSIRGSHSCPFAVTSSASSRMPSRLHRPKRQPSRQIPLHHQRQQHRRRNRQDRIHRREIEPDPLRIP